MGMEGDTIITQDVFLYDMIGEDAAGKIIGRHRSTGIGQPRFWERANISAKRSDLRPRSMPPKSSSRIEGDEHADARTGLHGRHRDRRPGVGLPLSVAVGREKAGPAALDRTFRARRRAWADKPSSRRERSRGR